jgi:hypothetical protein
MGVYGAGEAKIGRLRRKADGLFFDYVRQAKLAGRLTVRSAFE